MVCHGHLLAAKFYAFSFETKALLKGGMASQLDFSAGPEHAMPRQPVTRVTEKRGHLPGSVGEPRCSCDRPIG